MFKQIKKAVKWYLEKTAETYAWTPTCIIPYVIVEKEEEEK